MNLEELKRKREALEGELAEIVATEKAEVEGKLQTAAQALINEVKTIGYRGYFYEMPVDGEQPWTITVSRKKASGTIARAGREVLITKTGEPGRKYASCKEACKTLSLETGKDSAKRVLERHGYTVTYITGITVKGEPVAGEPVAGEPVAGEDVKRRPKK